jgi:hypothetical protein
MEWIKGFIIPLVEVILIGGIGGWLGFLIGRAVYKGWKTSGKFVWKYTIMRKQYNETTLKWVLNAIDQGIGYYDARKFLLLKDVPEMQVNETLWIYDKIINMMVKGGQTNGRGLKRSYSEIKGTTAELPKF